MSNYQRVGGWGVLFLFLALLLLPVSSAVPPTPQDWIVLKVFADEEKLPHDQVEIVVKATPTLYTTQVVGGSPSTEEKPVVAPVHIAVKNESGAIVAQCDALSNTPEQVGSSTFYTAVCHFTLPKGCYTIRANVSYTYNGRELSDTAATTLCRDVYGSFETFLNALGITDPSFFLNPQCFFTFTVFLLAVMALAYRGIGLHKVYDITNPKVPAKVFTFKYGYLIYHMGKELKSYKERIEEMTKHLDKSIDKILTSKNYKAVVEEMNKALDQFSHVFSSLGVKNRAILKAYLWGQFMLGNRDFYGILRSLRQKLESGMLKKAGRREERVAEVLLEEIGKTAAALDRHADISDLHEAALNAVAKAGVIVSEGGLSFSPKSKWSLFTKSRVAKYTTLLVVKMLKKGAPKEVGDVIHHPWRQVLADHFGEGFLTAGRLLRSLPGFEPVRDFLYKRTALRDWVQEARKAKKKSWRHKFILAVFGLSPDHMMDHTLQTEDAEESGKAIFHDFKMEGGKVLLYEYMKTSLEKAGVDLGELERALAEVDPQNLSKYVDAFSTTLEKIREAEKRGELDAFLNNVREMAERLEKANTEQEILKVYNEMRDLIEQVGGDVYKADQFLSVVEEAFDKTSEFDIYSGKVSALYEVLEERRGVLNSLGLWEASDSKEGSIGKFIIDLFGELSLKTKARLNLSELLLATNIFLFERNFGVGPAERVAEHYAKRVEDSARKAMGKKQAKEFAEQIREGIKEGVDKFYETVANYLQERGLNISKDEVPKFMFREKVNVGGKELSFEEVLNNGQLEGLRAFYRNAYLPKFRVADVEGAETTDAFQQYAVAASPAMMVPQIAFEGSSEQPFSVVFANHFRSTISELVAFANRGGLLTSEGKYRMERLAMEFYHILSLAAYTKAYEELGYWHDRTVQDSVKDEGALKAKAKEIMEKSTPEELIEYLKDIKWEIPRKLSDIIPFLLGPEGANPLFLAEETGAEGLPLLINKEHLIRLNKGKPPKELDKKASVKAKEIVMRSFHERDRTFLTTPIFYADKDGRLKYLPMEQVSPLYIKAFVEELGQQKDKLDLTDKEYEALIRALDVYYIEDPQRGKVNVFEEVERLQKEMEVAPPDEREVLRQKMEELLSMPPKPFEGKIDPEFVEAVVSALRKLEHAVMEETFLMKTSRILPKQPVSYESFARVVAVLSASLGRNFFPRLNRVVIGINPSLKGRLSLMWKKLNFNVGDIKDWIHLPSFVIGAVGEVMRQGIMQHHHALYDSLAYPNLEGYLSVTRFRTIQAYLIENYLLPTQGTFHRLLERAAEQELGFVPHPTLRAALRDIFVRRPPLQNPSRWERIKNLFRIGSVYFNDDVLLYRSMLMAEKRVPVNALELLVAGTWQVPRNEYLMAYYPSAEAPHVGVATGYHLGPFVGYTKWYSHFIYDFFPTSKFFGNLSHTARGWQNLFTTLRPRSMAEYALRIKGIKDQSKLKEKGKKVKAGFGAFWENIGAPTFYYSFLGTSAPALLPTFFTRGIMGDIQSYIISFSLAMGMHMARATRMFSAAFRYPLYQDLMEEYNEKAIEKLIDKALGQYRRKKDPNAVVRLSMYLSYVPVHRRKALLKKHLVNMDKDEANMIVKELQERGALPKPIGPGRWLPPIMLAPHWAGLAGRPATGEKQYYTHPSRTRAYGALIGEMVKNALPIYMAAFSPVASLLGIGMYAFARHHAEKSPSVSTRWKWEEPIAKGVSAVKGAIAGMKPSHWGPHLRGLPFRAYEGIKLPPYHFRWYIPGVAGFYEKTIGHGYLHGLTWEMVPEPWVLQTHRDYYARGFGLLSNPLRPQYHGVDIMNIVSRQQMHYTFYTPAENFTFTFLHPLFGISYLTNKLIRKREEWAEKRVIKQHYKALDVWSPYTPWKEKIHSLIVNPVTSTAVGAAALGFAFSGVGPFIATTALATSKAADVLTKGVVMGRCPACGAPKPKGDACPVCGFKPYSPDF